MLMVYSNYGCMECPQQYRMNHDGSILQWGSVMAGEPVVSLKQVQDVSFVKNMLVRIDPVYFKKYKQDNSESYQQVLDGLGGYFKVQIGTDIDSSIDGLNVYNKPVQVWQLLLGAAIKGNNRSNNINMIFQMDQALQAELVGIVSGIIDKFGQNALKRTIAEEDQEIMLEQNEKQRITIAGLIRENQELREQIRILQAELLKQKQDRESLQSSKTDLRHNLEVLRLQKGSLIQTLAAVNRSDSRIFGQDESPLQGQTSLAELGNDIAIFIRQQRKQTNKLREKNLILQQQMRHTRENAQKFGQDYQVYLQQLQHCKKVIQALRRQKNDLSLDRNLLMKNIAVLQNEKEGITVRLNKYQSQKDIYSKPVQIKEGLVKENSVKEWDEEGSQVYQIQLNSVPLQGGNELKEELRGPKRIVKLQRQVDELNKMVKVLQGQNSQLKKANEGLQSSARQFMADNQKIIGRWYEDYQELVQQIATMRQAKMPQKQLVQQNKPKQSSIDSRSQSQIASDQQKIPQNPVIQENVHNIESLNLKQLNLHTEIQENHNIQIQKQVNDSNKSIMNQGKTELFEIFVSKLQQIVQMAKSRQLAYQKQVAYLRSQNQHFQQQNMQLLQLISKRQDNIDKQSFHLALKQVENAEPKQTNAENHNSPRSPKRGLTHMSVFMADGEQEQERTAQFEKSNFFMANSRIIGQFQERMQFNAIEQQKDRQPIRQRKMSESQSFRARVKAIGQWLQSHLRGSGQLQRKLGQQANRVQKQYESLNSKYIQVFKQLNIYTASSEGFQKEYGRIMQQIDMTEAEVKADNDSQIVKLTINNQELRKEMGKLQAQRTQMIQAVVALGQKVELLRSSGERGWAEAMQKLRQATSEAHSKYAVQFTEPLQFIRDRLSGEPDAGQVKKYYNLWMSQKHRSGRLIQQLELMSSVLSDYRNMLE